MLKLGLSKTAAVAPSGRLRFWLSPAPSMQLAIEAYAVTTYPSVLDYF